MGGTPPARATRAALTRYFLGLGALGFGGPVALVGAMRRDLVEERGWLTEAEYREGLALAQMAPGPLAAQLAIYIGYVYGGALGAAAVGTAFVLPSLVMVLLLGWAYTAFGGLSWVQAVFYGVGAAVIGLIANSAYGLLRKTLGQDRLLWGIALVLAVATIATGRELVSLVLLAGLSVWFLRAPPSWLVRASARELASSGLIAIGIAAATGQLASSVPVLVQLLGFFSFAGSFVFGSGLAIVPFLHGGVVLDHRWLSEHQFRDAVAVALITPGPVVITTAFIGFLVAGLAGGLVAAAGTFLPCYLFTVVPAPLFRRYGTRPVLVAIVQGVTAAAVGAIAGAVVVLGRGAIFDGPTVIIAAGALVARRLVPRVPEPVLVLIAAAVGFGAR
ncbi:MAG TPA: chromate efflux transporter [Gemmatimonadales bacterium]|jgi:chromate transporter|nr:chromate efflux transporter [Gemmatimonadales bacterium]